MTLKGHCTILRASNYVTVPLAHLSPEAHTHEPYLFTLFCWLQTQEKLCDYAYKYYGYGHSLQLYIDFRLTNC
jgi:hypothetical protein